MINLPPPQIGKNRLLHDTELLRYNYKSRLNSTLKNAKLDTYPETVRYNSISGKTNVELSTQWQNFLESINTVKAFKFLHVLQNGYVNYGPFPKVEMLSFGGNFVEVTRIDGDKCYIKHYCNDQQPPSLSGDFYDDTLIQLFGVTLRNNTVEAPPCGQCRTLIISRTSSDELWISKEFLTFVGKPFVHKYPEVITVDYNMNLRDNHTITSNVTGRIPQFGKTQIEEVFQDGQNYWGRVGVNNWLCLKMGNQYFTSWRV